MVLLTSGIVDEECRPVVGVPQYCPGPELVRGWGVEPGCWLLVGFPDTLLSFEESDSILQCWCASFVCSRRVWCGWGLVGWLVVNWIVDASILRSTPCGFAV